MIELRRLDCVVSRRLASSRNMDNYHDLDSIFFGGPATIESTNYIKYCDCCVPALVFTDRKLFYNHNHREQRKQHHREYRMKRKINNASNTSTTNSNNHIPTANVVATPVVFYDDIDLHSLKSSTTYTSTFTTNNNKRHKNDDAQSIIEEALLKAKDCFEGKLREDQVNLIIYVKLLKSLLL